MTSFPLRVGVIGCGAFGRNHVRIYRNLPEAQLVGVYDRDPQVAATVALEFGTRTYPSAAALAEAVQAVSVAVPTAAHRATVLPLLEAGLDVLVEKPIAATLDDAEAMTAAAERGRRILQVGHLERFNPAVTLIRPRLTRPLFFEVHRLSVFTPRSLDVDVLLDLMIHDLDLVLSFVRAPIQEIHAVGLPVLTPRVDIANIRVSFVGGCVANFTASRVSTERIRKLRFFQPGEYISLDYTRQDAHLFALQRDATGVRVAQEHLTAPAAEPLQLEIQAFLRSVADRTPPEVGGAEAYAALRAALQAAAAIAAHAQLIGLPQGS